MNLYSPYILGIMDTINEWNDKLNKFMEGHADNIWVGIGIMGILILFAFWGLNAMTKK